MVYRLTAMGIATLCLLMVTTGATAADEQDAATVAAVRKSAAGLAAAFNAGKVADLSAMFLPKGELIDEQGTIYQGPKEIGDLLSVFFERFPGAKLAADTESIRMVGPVAIEEGTRTITTKDGKAKSQFRFIAVWAKTERGWQVASYRDFADDPAPTPHELLEPVAWLAGDWINEGADGKVAISYRWSEDKNFLLGEYEFTLADGSPRKATQRIGWDPSTGRIRSWLFDADGGFSEGYWTMVDDGIVVKSSSVNPDGSTASATMTIEPEDNNRFKITGTDRIVGDVREDDFEIVVVRRPSAAVRQK